MTTPGRCPRHRDQLIQPATPGSLLDAGAGMPAQPSWAGEWVGGAEALVSETAARSPTGPAPTPSLRSTGPITRTSTVLLVGAGVGGSLRTVGGHELELAAG